MKFHSLPGLAPILLLVAAFPCHGDEPPLVTDRPDQTESSEIVPDGRYQLEAGWTSGREEEAGTRVETSAVPGSLLRIGLAPRFELRLGWSGYVREETRSGGSTTDVDGAADAELGTKIGLWDEKGARPQTALIVGASVPVGADRLSSDRIDPSFRLCASHTLSERVGLGYNAGAAWTTADDAGGERDTLSDWLYTLSAAFGVNDRVGLFAEVFGEIPASAAGSPRNSLDGGVTYLLRDNLQLDAAAGIGVSEAAEDWFVGLGVSVRWPR